MHHDLHQIVRQIDAKKNLILLEYHQVMLSGCLLFALPSTERVTTAACAFLTLAQGYLVRQSHWE